MCLQEDKEVKLCARLAYLTCTSLAQVETHCDFLILMLRLRFKAWYNFNRIPLPASRRKCRVS